MYSGCQRDQGRPLNGFGLVNGFHLDSKTTVIMVGCAVAYIYKYVSGVYNSEIGRAHD